jgi:hypothetical protein
MEEKAENPKLFVYNMDIIPYVWESVAFDGTKWPMKAEKGSW